MAASAAPNAECRTLTEAYQRLGVKVEKIPRQLWSAKSEDGTVVVTLWSDRFEDVDRRVYDTYSDRPPKPWEKAPHNTRTELLKRVQAQSIPIFRSIIVTRSESQRNKVARREIGPKMRLVRFNPETGHFRAERVDR